MPLQSPYSLDLSALRKARMVTRRLWCRVQTGAGPDLLAADPPESGLGKTVIHATTSRKKAYLGCPTGSAPPCPDSPKDPAFFAL